MATIPSPAHAASSVQAMVVQSPMANTTDLPFRLLAREYGLRFAFLEMVSSEALVRDHAKTKELLKTVPEDKPLGVQIVGCHADVMGRAAQILEDMQCFEVLDINLGCPVPKVTGPGGGSALLREPDTAKAIFSSVTRSVRNIPVTVKMRIGYSDSSGQEAVRIAKIAEDCGISALAVHGRTRAQGYSGKADYEAIGKVKKAVGIPVIGNGDVVDAESALRLKEISGCDTVMIGRGALGNPWIYRQVEHALTRGKSDACGPSFEERKKTALRHLELQLRHDGPRCYLPMRRIACWYFHGVPGAAVFRERVNKAASIEEIRSLIEAFEP